MEASNNSGSSSQGGGSSEMEASNNSGSSSQGGGVGSGGGFASGIASSTNRMSFGKRGASIDSSQESSLGAGEEQGAAVDTLELEGGVNSFLEKLGECGPNESGASSAGGDSLIEGALAEGIFPGASDLQRKIRLSRDGQGGELEPLRALVSSARDSILSEWNTWEAQVANAIQQQVKKVADGTGDDEKAVDRHINFAEDTHESISLMAGRAVRKARRRSMRRRKTAASDIEEELRQLELQVHETEDALKEQREKTRALQIKTEAFNTIEKAKTDVGAIRSKAGANKDMLTSIENFACWTPTTLNSSEISLVCAKFANQPSLVLKFNLSEPGRIVYATSLMSSTNKKATNRARTARQYKCGPGVASFVRSRLEALCKNTAGEDLATQPDIAPVLQNMDLELCRLEMTAKEITSLQGRYQANFARDKGGNCNCEDFDLSVVLNSHDGELSVSASFLISTSYPFGPMEISLTPTNGSMKLKSLRRQLIKTAKPGFGYLSRTIDVIRASIGCRS